MVLTEHRPPRIARSQRLAIFVLVLLLHLALLWWFSLMRAAAGPAPLLPVMDIRLFDPPGGGGGTAGAASSPSNAPPAPSAVHPTADPQPWPDTVLAPAEPSDPAQLVISAETLAAEATPAATALDARIDGRPGAGGGTGGGVGDGAGIGRGSGTGPGSGRSSGAVLIRGPQGAVISRSVSPEALAALPGSYGVLRCRIRLSQRLDGCRVLAEHPAGSGAGRMAVERASEFRFRPPRRIGRFRDSTPITVAIAFPPETLDTFETAGVDAR